MISFEKAIEIINSKVTVQETITFDINQSLGYILAEDVVSDIFMPPFNKSAVDGYACKLSDLNSPIQVIETIPAGFWPTKEITAGTCSKIMTGAKVPEGADCVIMVEDCIDNNNFVTYNGPSNPGNIAFLGEDIKKGQKLIASGTKILSQHIAVMASAGYTQPLVYKKNVCAILSTGNELVEPNVIPQNGKIRNSNGYQLKAQLEYQGFEAKYLGIIPDTLHETEQWISNALQQASVIILSGGVSMGDYDFVPQALKNLGFEIHFDSISVQPGKPTTFASKNNHFCFALAGNPVSCFMHLNILVIPFLHKLMNNNYIQQAYQLPMAVSYKRKKASRKAFIPVAIENNAIVPVHYNGSAHINALLQATGYISLPISTFEISENEYVTYRPF